MMIQTEKQIQDQMLQWLAYQPKTFVWRQNAGSMFVDSPTGRHGFRSASVQGISDIMGVWQGKPIAIEVKRPGKKPTEMQNDFLKRFAGAGGLSIVAFSMEGLMEALIKVQKMPAPFNGMLVFEVSAKGKTL